MQLEDIGFYTLSDTRCAHASVDSNLMRCELILTDACNFKCPYCRGLRGDIRKTMPLAQAKQVVDLWAQEGLCNIRFSGGEPTVYRGLVELVRYTKALGVERIAVSTNGSADWALYEQLIAAGVDDFSVSLDACCSAYGDLMAGGITGAWERVVANIRQLSERVYTTVGIVVTEETVSQLVETIEFAASLGVADIRIISAAQYNALLLNAQGISSQILARFPILRYRIENLKLGRNVRGLQDTDAHQCGLILDDMAIAGNYHFPCIIYMRESGNAIGTVGPNMREERQRWFEEHDTHCDPICKKNCLDVCIDYNNKFRAYQADKQK